VVPIGPGEHELPRVRDLLDSLRAFTPDLDVLVLVDDAPADRRLAEHVDWDPERLVVLRPPQSPRSAHPHDCMTAGTLTFLRWLASERQVDYLVKLDTDALAIGDFRPSIERAMTERPEVGVLGAYRQNEAGGDARDFSMFRWPLRIARLPLRPRFRTGARHGVTLEPAVVGQRGRARRFVSAALASARRNGYELGEHCLGGAYVVTLAAAAQMHELGLLDDPLATYDTRLGEDVVVGLLARAAGFGLASLVGSGEAFAVKFCGLLAPPDALVARGHAIVHSVKDHDGASEDELRAAFASARQREPVR
jgi:hypothetical protein